MELKFLSDRWVLDRGYVRLVPEGTTASEITVVNAARVSYDKATDEMRPADERLMRFLAEHGHMSPFRHAHAQFEVYAPLMVARQWFKYVIGSSHQDMAWNESSRRYVTEEPVFYLPKGGEWRLAPENKKQGSGEPIPESAGHWFTEALDEHIKLSVDLYNVALESGVCAEQARLFLPAYGLYVRWYWTTSLEGLTHFLNQRLDSHSQVEIQEYAKAVYELAVEQFPITITSLVRGDLVGKEVANHS